MLWSPIFRAVTGDLKRLSDVWRYSSIPVISRENDIEHLGWVCMYSLLIHNELRPESHFLIGPIATHAISHDVIEAVTGDVVRTFKYSSDELRKAIKKAETGLFNSLPKPITCLIDSHKAQLKAMKKSQHLKYVEDVVKMADFLSLWMFMRREMLRNNQEVVPFARKMVTDLHLMGESFPKDDDMWDFYSTLRDEASSLLAGLKGVTSL